MNLTSLSINGLFGKFNVRINIHDNRLILIGPNGSGKSTIINILYYVLSRQWTRLREINFIDVKLEANGKIWAIRREDLEFLPERQTRPWTRLAERLTEAGVLDDFLARKNLTTERLRHFSNILRISPASVRNLHSDMVADLGRGEPASPIRAITQEIEQAIAERIVFLPTYRRIERELQAIFPRIEEEVRRMTEREGAFIARRSKHYIELVSFGMQDVKSLVDSALVRVREFSRNQLNNLAGSYLTDVIRQEPEKFDPKLVVALQGPDVDNILALMDERSLTSRDKQVIKTEILHIKKHARDKLDHRQQYLAHFFVKLMLAAKLIKQNDVALRNLAGVCNAYLSPDKELVYDDVSFSFNIIDVDKEHLDLKDLSSGEKQIISLFAHLLLDSTDNNIVIIDEPELSLSVQWQESFLPDIMETGKCDLLVAVTHSPFVYDNTLRDYACAVNECVVRSN